MAPQAPFPWFGGKRLVTDLVWERFGRVRHYIEPFFGSGAMLLGCQHPAALEVVGDLNGFLANFWRAVRHAPRLVAQWADYPVSQVDVHARHVWLMQQRERLAEALRDPMWPGDARVAGWWLWGQCAWIGYGWCDWLSPKLPDGLRAGDPSGVDGQALNVSGSIPYLSGLGQGYQASGASIDELPSIDAELSVQMLTPAGNAAHVLLTELSRRLADVRVLHGDWRRCLNTGYGERMQDQVGIFFDPPYLNFEKVYGRSTERAVADEVAEWARKNERFRIALCGHAGDYDLPGWDEVAWSRASATLGGTATKDAERIWFSPACIAPVQRAQLALI